MHFGRLLEQPFNPVQHSVYINPWRILICICTNLLVLINSNCKSWSVRACFSVTQLLVLTRPCMRLLGRVFKCAATALWCSCLPCSRLRLGIGTGVPLLFLTWVLASVQHKGKCWSGRFLRDKKPRAIAWMAGQCLPSWGSIPLTPVRWAGKAWRC